MKSTAEKKLEAAHSAHRAYRAYEWKWSQFPLVLIALSSLIQVGGRALGGWNGFAVASIVALWVLYFLGYARHAWRAAAREKADLQAKFDAEDRALFGSVLRREK